MKKKVLGNLKETRLFLENIFEEDLHAKRVESLANGTLGVLNAQTLGIHAIGLGLSHAKGLATKHAIKQVDRLIGNTGIDVWECFGVWVPYLVAQRTSILVALDWTDFDADGHATVSLNMLTQHGRATPLLWKTVKKSELKENRNAYEDEVLQRLYEILPKEIQVTVMADRGFADVKLFEFLHEELGFDYVIRLKKNIWVEVNGDKRKVRDWVPSNGRSKTLRDAQITQACYEVPTVVCVRAKAMKDDWCLASSLGDAKAAELIHYYGKRWGIESYFRDLKDGRFGFGMSETKTSSTQRRDRLILLSAFAMVLLTLLGASGESVGYDKQLQSNTSKKRQNSLFRQGLMIYQLLPTMPEKWLGPISERFSELLREQKIWNALLGFI